MGYQLEPSNASSVRTVLLAALIDGDLGLAYEITTGLLEEGVPFETLITDVIGPVQTEIGRRWADGDLNIADEHASTAATENLVALLAGTLGRADGPTVVIACPANDTHSLAGRVVSAALAVRGFRTLFLGASLPPDDLGEYLEHQKPMALALSVSMASSLFQAAQSVAIAHGHEIPVLIGGQAIGHDADRTRALGADAFASDATEAAALLDRWIVLPPEQLTPNAPIHPECVLIERSGPRIVAAVLDALSPAASETPELADELARILHVVQGALTLDDRGILVEHVDALRAADRAHGLEPSLVNTSIAELAMAMDGQLGEARALLRSLAA